MMLSKKLGLSLIALLVFCLPVQAVDEYEFDKSHTRIFFDVNHLGFSDYRGMFHEYDGTFKFDNEKLHKSKVDITIQMASADMYFDKMNEHLLAPDLLDAAKYPTARFVSKKVERTGDKSAKVHGKLTMRGITKPLTLDVVFNKQAKNPFSKRFTAGFTATATLDRTDYGINYAVPAVSKNVNLYIAVEAQKKE